MRKWLSLLTILFSLSSGFLYGEEPHKTINLAVIGNEHGFLEPCGCTEGMLGGIPRRQTAVEQIRNKNPDLLLIHFGNSISSFGQQAKIKRNAQIKDFNQLGLSVMGLGVSDFILGGGSLLLFKNRSNFPIIATNLKDTKGQLQFDKSFSKELNINGTTIGVKVFSVIDPNSQNEISRYINNIELEPYEEDFKQMRADKKNNEFWILLFHGPIVPAQKIARESDLFDLIIYDNQNEIPLYQKMGRSQMQTVGQKGRYFLNTQYDAMPPFALKNTNRIVLNKTYSESENGTEIIKNYKLELKSDKVAKNYPKVPWPDGAKYVGSKRCALCHKAEYKKWTESRHAHALDNLKEENNHYDPECIQCHTTGFQFQSGFQGFKRSKALGNVGCEMCHGPRSLHIKNPHKVKGKPATRSTCLQCHDQENSPNFDFDVYWPKIQHENSNK